MDAVDLLRIVSAQANSDSPVPRTKLGFIDYDFNPKTYPQVLPKVNIDGEGLSPYGYVCLSSYVPVPGDRVILLPHGTSHVILGSIEPKTPSPLEPGQLAFSANNDGVNQAFSGSVVLNWTATGMYDPFGFWDPLSPSDATPTIPGWYRVVGAVGFPTSAAGNRILQVRFNGSIQSGGHGAAQDMNSNSVRITHEKEFYFDGGSDYAHIRASLTSSNVTANYSGTFPSGEYCSWMTMYYVGPRIGPDT